MVLEEVPARKIDFLESYQKIQFQSVLQKANEMKPELFILLDAPNFERCCRTYGSKLRKLLKVQNIKVAIIDHHEEHGKDESVIYINNRRPATVQEVYELLFEKLHLKKPGGYAETTLLGMDC
jgi:nanoRNase/pAp phosphatase (c-di-AMP/oligoRNAs hydrolase)